MKITEVEAIPLHSVEHDPEQPDNMGETTLIVVRTDEGIEGFGEANVSPVAVKAFLEQPNYWIWNRGISDALIGSDPRDPAALWDDLYAGNWWSARNGIGHIAMAGVDIALWDIAGKAAGVPVWKLLGPERAEPLLAYITMYQGPSGFAETLEKTLTFIKLIESHGFKAAKIEAAPDRAETDDEIVELVRQTREQARPDTILLCDFCYRWKDAAEAYQCLRRLDDLDLFLLETPLVPDNVEGYRELATSLRTPIAGAEVLTSKGEFRNLLEEGNVAIIQPCVARVGLTEMHRLATYAGSRGRRLVPYGWVATTISMAATLHVAAVNPTIPLIEYVPPLFFPEAALRREIAGPEPTVSNGAFDLPAEPGLGVQVNLDAIAYHRVEVAAL